MKAEMSLTIGRLAREAGVGVETIRFYERKGLIRKPPKGEGYRRYPAEEARRIHFVRRVQELGFTLREIKELLELKVSSRATCGDIKRRADTKLAEVEAKIRDLRRMKSSLQRLSLACGMSTESTQNCRVLDCFENEWKC